MDISEFRQAAHGLVDWMADYLQGVEEFPVKARVAPGEVASQLPAAPPASPEAFERIMDDFRSIVVPGMTHWQHPSFFAYFPANSSPPSVLAEMLTATMAAQCMSWETSPAATEMEQRLMQWLGQMLGLPAAFVGSIQDTASTATLCALLVAREQVTDSRANEEGLSGVAPLTTYCSAEAHSSIEKAVKIAGLGRENLRRIPVDSGFALRPDLLEKAIERDAAAGNRPTCVVACLGTTGTSGIDSLTDIAPVCQRHGVWLHVDAAWAGSALILPEYRWMLDGVDGIDSIVVNPHKWLFTNFDCSALFVRDAAALVRTFEILPEYLKTRHGDTVTNYRDWGIQLGRRFRALKLWFVIRSYGVEGLMSALRSHIQWAQELARDIDAAPDFELLAPATLALLCFRYVPQREISNQEIDELNRKLLEAVNDGGSMYVTHTRIRGVYAIRFAVGQTSTQRTHVRAAWDAIQRTARSLDTV